jgi:hypothetical protein
LPVSQSYLLKQGSEDIFFDFKPAVEQKGTILVLLFLLLIRQLKSNTMKKLTWGFSALFIVVAIILSFQFSRVSQGRIKGKLLPVDGASSVRAVSLKDTFITNIVNGNFELKHVTPGQYRLLIDAIPPYLSTSKPGVQVKDGAITDVGLIQLEGMDQ